MLKFTVKNSVFHPIKITSHINYLQTRYCFWIHIIQSHIFMLFTDIPHISFHPLIFYFSLIIALNSSWLISMSIIQILILSCFFFLFFVMLSNFFIILVVREKTKVKLGLAILAICKRNGGYSTSYCS